jgi:hypothetical protein
MNFVKWGLVLSVCISLALFLRATDFQEVFDLLGQIGWKVAYILLSTFSAYVLGSLGWKYCLGAEAAKTSTFRLFVYRQVGETLALFNPTSIVAGDWLKSRALKKQGVQEAVANHSVILARILMVLTQMALLIIALSWLLLGDELSAPWRTGVGIVLASLLVALSLLLYMLFKNAKVDSRWKTWNTLLEYKNALGTYMLEHPKKTAIAALFMSLHWIAGSLEMFFILHFLGYDVTVFHGLLMDMGVILIKSVGAFIPGQLGLEELANKTVIFLIGISSASLWISVSIIKRARQLFWSIVGGILYLIYRKEIV